MSNHSFGEQNIHDDWNPMRDAYQDPHFNTYKDGPGANLELHNQPCNAGSRKNTGPVTLFVGNIPVDLDRGGLENAFRRAGEPIKIFKAGHTERGPGNFGFVTFATYREAEEGVRLLNRKPPMNFRVEFARPQTGNSHSKPLSTLPAYNDDVSMSEAKSTEKRSFQQPRRSRSIGRGIAVAPYVDPRTPGPNIPLEENADPKYFQQYNGSNYDQTNFDIMRSVQRSNGPGGHQKFVMGRGSFDRASNRCHPMNLHEVVEDPEEAKKSIEKYVQRRQETYEYSKREYPPHFEPRTCTLCGKPATQFCANCKDYYCSRACQEEDWTRHKRYCVLSDKGSSQKIDGKIAQNLSTTSTENNVSRRLDCQNDQQDGKEEEQTRKISPCKEKFVNPKAENVTLRSEKNSSEKANSHGKRETSRLPESEAKNLNIQGLKISPRKGKRNEDNEATVLDLPWSKSKNVTEEGADSKEALLYSKIKLGCEENEVLPSSFTNVTVQVAVAHDEYWVQLSSNLQEVYSLSHKMKLVKDPAPIHPSVGAYCMAKYTDIWCRAKIISVKPKLQIFYIDFGNEETKRLIDVRTLPETVQSLKSQAIRIKLAPGTSGKFFNLQFGQELSVKCINKGKVNVVHVEGETYKQPLKVQDTDTSSNEIAVTTDNQEIALQNVTVLLKSRTNCFIHVTEYSDSQEFIATLVPVDMKTHYNDLFNQEFQEECENMPSHNFVPDVGDAVVAKFESEGWLRAYVLFVSRKKEYTVASCDVGCVEIVKCVKKLPKKCREIAQFAVQCCVKDNTKLKIPVNYTTNVIIAESTSETAVAEIDDEQSGIKCNIRIEKWVAPFELYQELKCVDLKDGDCVISAEMSAVELYIRPLTNSCIEIYNRLLQDVAKHCFTAEPLKYTPKVGQVLAAQFSEDNNCYRAVVREVHPVKGVKVQYIDFGNVEYVKKNLLFPLPKKLRELECSVVKVVLEDVVDKPLNEELQDLFKDLILRPVVLKIKLSDSQSNRVRLYMKNGTYLNEKINNILVPGWKKGHIDTHLYTAKDIVIEKLEPGEIRNFVVMSVLDSCIIVRSENSKIAHVLANDLQPAIDEYCEQTNEPYTPREMELCLANVENVWYRCICFMGGLKLSLYRIDMGDVCSVTHDNIRKFLHEFMLLPAVCLNCEVITPGDSSTRCKDTVMKYLSTMKIIRAEVLQGKATETGLKGYTISIPELDDFLLTL